jgi:hypothetical protein
MDGTLYGNGNSTLEGLVPAGKRCTAHSYALVWGATLAQCTLVFSLFLLAMALGGLC